MSKKSDGNVMSESYDAIATFSIYSQFGAKNANFFQKNILTSAKLKEPWC